MRVKVEPLAAAPLAIATAEIVFASADRRGLNGIGRNRPGNHRRRKRHAAFGEKFPQLFQRAVHAHFCRVLARAQRRADFAQILVLKKTQHDGVAVFLAEPAHRVVQQRRDLPPGFRFRFVQNGLHICLLFAVLPADFAAQKIRRRQPRGLIQPAGKNCRCATSFRLPRQNDEHRLRDFLGRVRVADAAQRGGINQIDVPSQRAQRTLLRNCLRRIAFNSAMSSDSGIYQ